MHSFCDGLLSRDRDFHEPRFTAAKGWAAARCRQVI